MKRRISNTTASLLILGTLIVELLQAVTNFIGVGFILNPIVSIFIWLTAYFIFTTHDVSVFSTRKLAAALTSATIEMIPFIAALPAWTLYVISIIVISRREDRTHHTDE